MPDTGAPWFIPYVEDTDLVADWPTDSLALANAIVAALEDLPVKKIEAFTASGTWTVPAGVTYAIAHMLGGGGGGGGQTGGGTDGGSSSVAFASGTVTALGGKATAATGVTTTAAYSAPANSGRAGTTNRALSIAGGDAQWIVAGADVTPAASITVTVGNGGTGGTGGGQPGGSGYVYIEYYE